MYQLIGIAGATLIVVSWLPQIIKLVKTKSSKDFSLNFLFIVLLGSMLLTIYSAYISDVIFTILNALASINSLIVLSFVLHYRKH